METIKTQEFIETLKICMVGISPNEQVPQGSCFVFRNNEITTYNNSVQVVAPFEISEFQGALPAKQLLSFLNKIKTETISISFLEESCTVMFKSARTKLGLKLDTQDLLPKNEVGEIDESKFIEIPEGFMENLQLASNFTGTDSVEWLMTCVHVTQTHIESTDYYRLFQAESNLNIPNSFLLPTELIRPLKTLEINSICVTNSWVHFKCNDCILSVRISSEEFKDTSKVWQNIEMESKSKIEFPSDTQKIIDQASTIYEGVSKNITCILDKNKFQFEAKNETGFYKTTRKIKYTGPKLKFQVNSEFLKQILNNTCEANLLENSIHFKNENWKALILLIQGKK